MTAHVLGFMVHVLDVMWKICEWCLGVTSDGYISASIDLAHKYSSWVSCAKLVPYSITPWALLGMGRSQMMSVPFFCSGMQKRWWCWKIYLGMKLLYLRFSL